MQFDKNTLNTLLSQSDDMLWQTIRRIASASKINLPSTPPPPSEMARLRSVLNTSGGMDMVSAMKIVEDYRRKHGS